MTLMLIRGERELIRTLNRLPGRRLFRVVSSATRDVLWPMTRTARRLVPVHTGRLGASLGVAVSSDPRRGMIFARLGPRLRFSFTSGGVKRAVGATRKQRERLRTRGVTIERTFPHIYAHGIEFGRDRRGRLRRKAGGARFLERAFDRHAPGAERDIGTAVRRHIDRTAK